MPVPNVRSGNKDVCYPQLVELQSIRRVCKRIKLKHKLADTSLTEPLPLLNAEFLQQQRVTRIRITFKGLISGIRGECVLALRVHKSKQVE